MLEDSVIDFMESKGLGIVFGQYSHSGDCEPAECFNCECIIFVNRASAALAKDEKIVAVCPSCGVDVVISFASSDRPVKVSTTLEHEPVLAEMAVATKKLSIPRSFGNV